MLHGGRDGYDGCDSLLGFIKDSTTVTMFFASITTNLGMWSNSNEFVRLGIGRYCRTSKSVPVSYMRVMRYLKYRSSCITSHRSSGPRVKWFGVAYISNFPEMA